MKLHSITITLTQLELVEVSAALDAEIYNKRYKYRRDACKKAYHQLIKQICYPEYNAKKIKRIRKVRK